MKALYVGERLDVLVDGLSINYGWAWRDTPANPFNFEPGDWITALAFDWIVHNELNSDPEDSSRKTIRALGGAVLTCDGFRLHRSDKVLGDLLTDASAAEAAAAKRLTRSTVSWV